MNCQPVLRIQIRRIRLISPDRYEKLGWIRNPDPDQMIRIRINKTIKNWKISPNKEERF